MPLVAHGVSYSFLKKLGLIKISISFLLCIHILILKANLFNFKKVSPLVFFLVLAWNSPNGVNMLLISNISVYQYISFKSRINNYYILFALKKLWSFVSNSWFFKALSSYTWFALIRKTKFSFLKPVCRVQS